jgi:hypothetical protein
MKRVPRPSSSHTAAVIDVTCVVAACAGAVLLGLALLDASAYGRFLYSLLVR